MDLRVGLLDLVPKVDTSEVIRHLDGEIQQYISKIETGRENVTVDTLTRIADILNKKLVIELK
ncbi:MAG: helix-turn-helix transcriptional regulator [Candidatus Omnitrophota bacterium]